MSSKGVVKAVKKGKATITVKVKGTSRKATCKMTVNQKPTSVVYGNLSIEELKRKDKNAKCWIEYSESEGRWYLILQALNGTKRTYSVQYACQLE